MNVFDKARIIAQLGRSAFAWVRRDTAYPSPVPENPKFMSARDAVALIRDGDVLADSGLGGNQRSSSVYWAIRQAFEKRGHPAGLTVMNLGGHGGRGRVPGTLEELGVDGLCTRFFTGHFETFKAMLDLAAAGRCELQCVPQGTMALLFAALARGENTLVSDTGVGTFIDPRVGSGSRVGGRGAQWVGVRGNRLRYRIPRIDVALFNAPAADRFGNIYMKHAAMIGESREIAQAARHNRGRVIAAVGQIVEKGYDDVFLPAEAVDAIVFHPDTEQTSAVFHRDAWLEVTPDGDGSIAEGLERAQFVSALARVTAQRSPADQALARLAAWTLAGHVARGAYVNIGVGLPEQVAQIFFTAGALDDVTFLVESGPVGGLPAPGAYFGASLHPRRIISSAEMFALCYERLDATCLGVLQADSEGNVNVSRRGTGPQGFVGPGGFIDLSTAAHTIVFVSAWTKHGEIAVDGAKLRVRRAGEPKFVECVDEITFNGPRARAAGKDVFYATHVGLFHLGARGMELAAVMPGIDVRRDILAATPMRIALPHSGDVPVVPASVISGEDFHLALATPRVSGGRQAHR